MNRVTQREESQYQRGRRDAFNNAFEVNDNAMYLAGWREGTLERMELEKESSDDNR